MASGKDKGKQPKVATQPVVPDKIPKFRSDPTIKGKPLVWRFSHGDRAGPFPWVALFDTPADLAEVLGKLADFETMNETDIRAGGSHSVPLSDLCKDAQDRLENIRQDDLESLFSLRINGRIRVWAIHDDHVMRILWFDPEHRVCPALLRHT